MELTFKPRPYQIAAMRDLHAGIKRHFWLWHRRSGKDMTAWNWVIYKALTEPGGYMYFLPTYKQAEKVIWHNMTRDGKRFLDFIPREALAKKPNDTDLRVELVNGSIIQLIGADNFDGNVGMSFKGAVFSEYAIMDPRGWQFMSPIALESGGWVIFVTTPRGHNHAYEMYLRALNEIALGSGIWAVHVNTVDDTKVLDTEALEAERRQQPEALFQQEFYCRFDVANTGAVFGKQVENARREGRVTRVPYDPSLQVHTAWDLGVNDPTAVWFFQRDHTFTRVIDYYEAEGRGLEEHVRVIHQKPYNYGTHLFPHDMAVKEWGSGRTRFDTAQDLGLRDGVIVPKWAKEDQFHSGRNLLPTCVFDEAKCSLGLEHLAHYGFKFDESVKTYSKQPKDNEHSHGADAFMVLSVGNDLGYVDIGYDEDPDQQMQVIGTFSDPRDQRRSAGYASQFYQFRRA